MMNLQDFQDQLLNGALKNGFNAAEIYISAGRSLEVRVFEGEIAHYENSRQQGICFRGLINGKMGYAFSEKMAGSVIPYLLQEAAGNAEILSDKEREDLFAGEPWQPADTYNAGLAAIEPEQIITAARQIEKGGLAADPRIRGVEYALAEYSEGERTIANTLGLSVSQRSNLLLAFALVRAEDGPSIKQGNEIWQGRDLAGLDAAATGRRAAALALGQLGARSLPSGRYPVLFDCRSAVDLLQAYLPVFFADKIQQGFSMLGGKTGQLIAAPPVSLADDPRCPASLYWPAFDSEGSATRRTDLIRDGRLEGILHNRKTAARSGAHTTGNGFKPSYKSPVQVAATNSFLVPGSSSPAGLAGLMDRGILVTGLSGLHAGTNLVSGDFSLLAEGFLIEKGQRAYPVEQITIAGNFYQLLQDVTAVGNDLWFGMPGSAGQIGSPSFLVGGLAVSGT